MRQYLDTLKYVKENGVLSEDRTGVGTISTFGVNMRFDLSEGFPAVTTKKLAWKSVVSELLWFLEGSTDERRLAEIRYGKRRDQLLQSKTIWTDNANHQGVNLGYRNDIMCKELGPVYGKQWRDFNGVDQISELIQSIQNNPYSRRHILSAWNVSEINKMTLPPCHLLTQFYVRNGKLSSMMFQRSADIFLGVPFNIASYALLTHLIAKICRLEVGEFIWSGGDVHIYTNHVEQIETQIQRNPLSLPKLQIPDFNTLSEVLKSSVDDYKLMNYEHHNPIKAEMAV